MTTRGVIKADKAKDQLIIRGKKYSVRMTHLDQQTLKFYADNPRIYSAVHGDNGVVPSQEDIQEYMEDLEYVRELKEDIRQNEGLIEPLYVKSDTLEVVEGNSRLAAYRLLAAENAVTWRFVKCILLPREINESAIASLLGQLHLKGKKDWNPYEQASYLHRRHRKYKVSVQDLQHEFGLRDKAIKHRIAVIDFMIEYDDNNVHRWSYYDELLKSRKFKEKKENYPDLEEQVVRRIQSGEIPKAADIRDKLKVVVGTRSEKPIKQLLAGGTLEEAFQIAKRMGGDNTALRKLQAFRSWLGNVSRAFAVAPTNVQSEMRFELKKIHAQVTKLIRAAKSSV